MTAALVTADTEYAHGVSIVLCTASGSGRILTTLQSLAHQTLAPELFEIIIVSNGPEDGTREVVNTFLEAWPNLNVRFVRIPLHSVNYATNIGLASVRYSYTTFIDDDDWVSENYLAALLESASPDSIAIAYIADVDPESLSKVEWDNYVNRSISLWAGQTVPWHYLHSATQFNTAKLVWSQHAKSIQWDTNLSRAPDVVYWASLCTTQNLEFHVLRPEDNAVYFRLLRPNSHSRGGDVLEFDYEVLPRLDAIASLCQVQEASGSKSWTPAKASIESIMTRIGRYLAEYPDEHQKVLDTAKEMNLSYFPVCMLNRDRARDLAIAYLFLPALDTSAFISARRMRNRGLCFDVVTADPVGLRKSDRSNLVLARDYVGAVHTVKNSHGFGSWASWSSFANEGYSWIEQRQDEIGQYRSVYSRAMWPHSHVLGGLVKIRNPEIRWIAEFSDPLSHDVQNELRKGQSPSGDSLSDELNDAITSSGWKFDDNPSIYVWLENLVYACADEIWFTNENQMEYMLSLVTDEDLQHSIRERAVVSHHPVPPKEAYSWSDADPALDTSKVNFAYFGNFYPTRGLTEVVSALRRLTKQERTKTRIHIFTSDPEDTQKAFEAEGLGDIVTARPFVPYLEMLRFTEFFDCLIVNDSKTVGGRSINPYLPSKVSDYLGSGQPIWAITEPGSVLDNKSGITYKSHLGDDAGAEAVLHQVINQ